MSQVSVPKMQLVWHLRPHALLQPNSGSSEAESAHHAAAGHLPMPAAFQCQLWRQRRRQKEPTMGAILWQACRESSLKRKQGNSNEELDSMQLAWQ